MASDARLSYAVCSGRRTVRVMKAWSAADAVIEYLVGIGCRTDELVLMGPSAIIWRGATFTATPAPTEHA